jgi:hypothetical protein
LEVGWGAPEWLIGFTAFGTSVDRSRVAVKPVSADVLATNVGGNLEDDDDETGLPRSFSVLTEPIGLNPEALEDEEMGANPADLKPEGLKVFVHLSSEVIEGSGFWLAEAVEGCFVHPEVGFWNPPLPVCNGSALAAAEGLASRFIPAARAILSSSLASLLRSFSSLASVERPVDFLASFASRARFA